MTHRATHHFPTDHPTASGHFPGDPIIPGACLLREILAAIGPATHIDTVKFQYPVRPGDTIAIEWREAANGSIRFSCSLDPAGTIAVTGALRMAPP